MPTHNFYLEKLTNNLGMIDESPRDIAWIIKEGVWLPENGDSKNKMPDLILYYYSGKYSLVELKGNFNQTENARLQLESGKEFVQRFFNARDISLKLVVYCNEGFSYEVL